MNQRTLGYIYIIYFLISFTSSILQTIRSNQINSTYQELVSPYVFPSIPQQPTQPTHDNDNTNSGGETDAQFAVTMAQYEVVLQQYNADVQNYITWANENPTLAYLQNVNDAIINVRIIIFIQLFLPIAFNLFGILLATQLIRNKFPELSNNGPKRTKIALLIILRLNILIWSILEIALMCIENKVITYTVKIFSLDISPPSPPILGTMIKNIDGSPNILGWFGFYFGLIINIFVPIAAQVLIEMYRRFKTRRALETSNIGANANVDIINKV